MRLATASRSAGCSFETSKELRAGFGAEERKNSGKNHEFEQLEVHLFNGSSVEEQNSFTAVWNRWDSCTVNSGV